MVQPQGTKLAVHLMLVDSVDVTDRNESVRIRSVMVTDLTTHGLIQYLRAGAPRAERPLGVHVLSSHTEDILLRVNIHLELSLRGEILLHKRRGHILKTIKVCTESENAHLW